MRDASRSADLVVSPGRLVGTVFLACVAVEVGLVVLDYHVNFGRLIDVGAIRRFSNIAREDGLASLFGTLQTFVSALTVWLIYLVSRAQGAAAWRRAGWLMVAVFFTYMAIDDGAQIHERVGTTYDVLVADAVVIFPSYSWQVVLLPAFVVAGVGMLWFLWFELADRRLLLGVLAALGCFALAVVLDFFEGLDADHPANLYARAAAVFDIERFARLRFGQSAFNTFDHFSRSAEEFLEMLANTLLWCVFLWHLTATAETLRVTFARRR